MASYVIQESTLREIADAVRAKTDRTDSMSPEEMAEAIRSIIPYHDGALDGLIMRTSEVVESSTATSVAAYAFFMNPVLRTAVLPAVLTIGDYAFCDCVNLERISFGATRIGGYAFSGCDALQEVLFSENLTEIGVAAFSGCDELQVINLRKTLISRIAPSAFESSGVNEIHLPENRFCSLTNAGSFSGTPIGVDGSGGTIYVPRRFRVSYEADGAWGPIFRNANNRVISY